MANASAQRRSDPVNRAQLADRFCVGASAGLSMVEVTAIGPPHPFVWAASPYGGGSPLNLNATPPPSIKKTFHSVINPPPPPPKRKRRTAEPLRLLRRGVV